MDSLKVSLNQIIIVGLFMCLAAKPAAAVAAHVTFEPAVNLTGTYTDNVYFSRTDKKDDYYGTAGLRMNGMISSEVCQMDASFATDVIRYVNENERNTENYRCRIGGRCDTTEKLRINATASFTKDETIESEFQETGRFTVLSDRYRYSGECGFIYSPSQRASMGLNYTYTNTDYDWEGNIDYDYHAVFLPLNWNLKTLRDTVNVQPFYMHYYSRASVVDNYGLSLGWHHNISETTAVYVSAGARYTETEYSLRRGQLIYDPTVYPPFRITYRDEKKRERNWGGVADIYFLKTGETYSARAGYARNLSYTSYGEPIERNHFYISAEKSATYRLVLGLTASCTISEAEGEYSDEDTRHLSIQPSLRFNLTQYHIVQFAYEYSWYYDKAVADNRNYDRNRIWIFLTFRFPHR